MTTIDTRATPQAREAAGDALVCRLCARWHDENGCIPARHPGEPIGYVGRVMVHETCYTKECRRRGNHVHE